MKTERLFNTAVALQRRRKKEELMEQLLNVQGGKKKIVNRRPELNSVKTLGKE